MFKINVVNFHITDICNFKCKYCFIKKEGRQLPFEKAKKVVDKIEAYFIENNIHNGRINIAGGEPLMYPYLKEIIEYIYSKKIKISIITNGSLLNDEVLSFMNGKVDTIGLSIDSLDGETNILIGRSLQDKVLTNDEIVLLCYKIKENKIKLKINICVSKYNLYESFNDFLYLVRPDRLKLLQMTIIDQVNDNCAGKQVARHEFESFCDKLKIFNPVIEGEEEMKDSYLIVDSSGNLSMSNDHTSKKSIFLNSMNSFIENINIKKYFKRY